MQIYVFMSCSLLLNKNLSMGFIYIDICIYTDIFRKEEFKVFICDIKLVTYHLYVCPGTSIASPIYCGARRFLHG